MSDEMDFDLDAIITEDRDCRDVIKELNQMDTLGMDLIDEEEYNRKLEEQKRRREEYLAFKAQRRRQSVAEHEFYASLALKEIKDRERISKTKDKQTKNCNEANETKQKKKPLAKVDTNVLKTLETIDRIVTIKEPKPSPCNKIQLTKNKESLTQNDRFGATTVLIQNLSAQTNEYTFKEIGETIGHVIGVCIALEGNVRKAMVRFHSPVDALLFQKKYDNHHLGSTIIKTSLVY